MQIDVSCQHTTLTPALRSVIEEKFARLSQHIDRPVRAHVVLRVDPTGHRAEANIRGIGKPVHAEAVEPDMYAAIDRLVDVLDRQWRKRKTSVLRRTRGRPAQTAALAALSTV